MQFFLFRTTSSYDELPSISNHTRLMQHVPLLAILQFIQRAAGSAMFQSLENIFVVSVLPLFDLSRCRSL